MILLKAISVTNDQCVTVLLSFSGFTFKDFVCNGCQELRMMCPNLRDVDIITVTITIIKS